MAEAVSGKRRRALESAQGSKRAKVDHETTKYEMREDGVSGGLERGGHCAKNDVASDGSGGVGSGEGMGVRSEEGKGVRSEEGKGARCGFEFYNQSCENLAKAMLGCVLVCVGESGEECRGRVVETEAYLGGEDKAAHSYNGRQSKANEAMFMPPGTAYVYSIYGMHCCFNVSSCGDGAAVLVRALEPVSGQAVMRRRRGGPKKETDFCNGPGKLCQAMGITKSHNKENLVTSSCLWLESHLPLHPEDIGVSARIGIEYAGPEWAAAQLRFHELNCPSVSKHYKRQRKRKTSKTDTTPTDS